MTKDIRDERIHEYDTLPTEDPMESNEELPTREEVAAYEARVKALVADGFTEAEARELLAAEAPTVIPDVPEPHTPATREEVRADDLDIPPSVHEPEQEAPALVTPVGGDEGPEDEAEIETASRYDAKSVARHFEEAPAHIEIPESKLPVGTEIVVEAGYFTFKLPGRNAVPGKGRTIGGAMIDAGILV